MELRAAGGGGGGDADPCHAAMILRDHRVVRSLGLEVQPPYPKVHVLEDSDWTLLDPQSGAVRRSGVVRGVRDKFKRKSRMYVSTMIRIRPGTHLRQRIECRTAGAVALLR
jgi:hypothetical protein